ncbi:hypothetical protein [Klebsiella quasivariicola]|uniref:hypothetical protein n=1 Tax=Klebsiella quasivariicola TaxID=2026240 RepID=UPI002479B207|nr:hypothetical protein [Klebsiella quasivariicola]
MIHTIIGIVIFFIMGVAISKIVDFIMGGNAFEKLEAKELEALHKSQTQIILNEWIDEVKSEQLDGK